MEIKTCEVTNFQPDKTEIVERLEFVKEEYSEYQM